MSKAKFTKKEWNAVCDRCGFEYKASKLREEWTGLMVCKGCWEPRHPQELLQVRGEDQAVPWSRPEGTDAGGTDISGTTFPPTFTDTTDDVPSGSFNTSTL